MKAIDINCDLGEGGEFDADLMPLISSCNIACGGHYGNEESVFKAVELAKYHSVHVGAHPSYPDVDNFGRQSLTISPSVLKSSLHEQIDLVVRACKVHQVNLHHIKPHGALYNDMRKHPGIADLVMEVLRERHLELILFSAPYVKFSTPSKSIDIWIEGFADRAYQNDLSLVSRSIENAVLHDSKVISDRVLRMISKSEILTMAGEVVHHQFDTICVHSDTPNAFQLLKDLRMRLTENGIKIGN